MDLVDRKLLNAIQTAFPLVDQPYQELGKQLSIPEAETTEAETVEAEITESEVIERLGNLKRQNVLRQISAIFDTRRLGYQTTLVAFAYEPDQLNSGALFINRHPGVSHNYAREGSYYNLWFTLAVPGDGDLDGTIQWMARETNALDHRVMPTIRFFKIGVNFDMVKQKGAAHQYNPDAPRPDAPKTDSAAKTAPGPAWNQAVPLTESDKAAIRELQEDLALIPRPFDAMAERLGYNTGELFQLAAEFQERKLMRRFSAVLHHRRSGFRSNAMIVWKVPSERSEEVGMLMAENPAVTHCYERPTFPDWPYTHFTMVHATTAEGCEEVEREISQATGITENQLLYSTREYKKTRVRYFVEDYQEFWEQESEDTEAAPELAQPSPGP